MLAVLLFPLQQRSAGNGHKYNAGSTKRVGANRVGGTFPRCRARPIPATVRSPPRRLVRESRRPIGSCGDNNMVAAVSLRNSGTAPTCRSSWLGATDGPHSQTKLSSGKKMQVQPQSVPVIGIYQSGNELEHADGGVACEAEQRIAERPGPPPSLLLRRLQLPRLSAGGANEGAHLSPVIGRASSKQIAFAYRLRLFRSYG